MLHVYFKKGILFTGLMLLSISVFAMPNQQASINEFIKYMVQHDHYPKQQLTHLLQQQKPNQHILNIEYKPYEKQSWPIFKKLHFTSLRVQQGVQFFHKHQHVLMQMQKQYGVDPYVITAILGFESGYGQDIGHFRALDSLYTLGFYYPPRAHYFSKELESLLLLARDWHKPVQTIESSFDGGLGMAQFMPDKYRQEAVAYKADHYPDLLHNANDAIMSIATYLKDAGWQKHGWMIKPVLVQAYVLTPICNKKLRAASQLTGQGFIVPKAWHIQKAGCAHLEDNQQTDYWLLGPNYYVIKRYNPDLYYALIIKNLSDAIHQNS